MNVINFFIEFGEYEYVKILKKILGVSFVFLTLKIVGNEENRVILSKRREFSEADPFDLSLLTRMKQLCEVPEQDLHVLS